MAKISSTTPASKRSRVRDEDSSATGNIDAKAESKRSSKSKAAEATKAPRGEPDRYVASKKGDVTASSVGRTKSKEAERLTPSKTSSPANGPRPHKGLKSDPPRAGTAAKPDGTVLRDADGVSLRGKPTTVYTTSTDARRGDKGNAPSLDDRRDSLRSTINEEAAAGRVSSSLTKKGTLRVKGSDRGDNITVDRNGDTLTVRSGEKTIGSYSASEVQKVKIEARKGNDRVNVDGLDDTAVSLQTGRGADVARVIDTKGTRVKTGDGADVVELAGTVGTKVSTGNGGDTIHDVGSRDLLLKAGGGGDKLRLTGSLDSKVQGGGGRDMAVLVDVNNVRAERTRISVHTSAAPPQASSARDLTGVEDLAPFSGDSGARSISSKGGGALVNTPLPERPSLPSTPFPAPRRGLGTLPPQTGTLSSSIPSQPIPSQANLVLPEGPPTVITPPVRHEDQLDLSDVTLGAAGGPGFLPGPGGPPVTVGRRDDPVLVRGPALEAPPSLGGGGFSPLPAPVGPPPAAAGGENDDDVLGFSS
ncbi:MAG: hypothetical protein ACO3JL_07345 [Myxococcota bacterium]